MANSAKQESLAFKPVSVKYVFCPFLFLKTFLDSEQQHPHLLGKRLFAYLESMAQSSDIKVSEILAYHILESLSQKQLEVAKIYMGPKTKETLEQVEEFWEKVGTWQAWFNAIEYNDIQQVKLLLDQGFDPTSPRLRRDIHHAFSPRFSLGVAGAPAERRRIDINSKNHDGCTALHIAAYRGHQDIIALLLKRGADTSLKDKDGYTARMYAQEYGHSEIVELLEQYEKKLC